MTDKEEKPEDTRKEPTQFDEMYQSRFIKGVELKGQKVTLRISKIYTEILDGLKGKCLKGILYFYKTDKGFPLNVTNGRCIQAMFGDTLAGWKEKRVTLFVNDDGYIRVWGSPDIEKEIRVKIKLPKRSEFTMIMHVVKRATNGSTKTEPEPSTTEDSGLDTEPDREPGDEAF